MSHAPPGAADIEAPHFTGASMVRRVNREGVVLLGGGRALLMQVAHPLIARGVAEHSDFRQDRLGRLLRTLRPMYAIAFGTPEQARHAASGVRDVHTGVRGPRYSAEDAELMRWVLATLVDSALVIHGRFLRPLNALEREGYYADMCAVGGALGLPPRYMPPDVPAFERYVAEMNAGLEVEDPARGIARELFRPLGPLTPALAASRWLTAGLLPAPLRRGYGMRWSPRDAALLAALERASRATLPHVPLAVRATPAFLLPPPTKGSGEMTDPDETARRV